MYIGGLTSAINTFRSHLQENPLPHTLRAEIQRCESRALVSDAEAQRLRDQVIPSYKRKLERSAKLEASLHKAAKKTNEDLIKSTNALNEERTTSSAQIRELKQRVGLLKDERDRAME